MITSLTNERVKYIRSLADKKFRQEEGCFLVEGVRLVEEALQAGAKLRLVLYEPELVGRTPKGRDVIGRLPEDLTFSVTEKVIKSVSQTVSPQGILAAVEFPRLERKGEEPVILVLDSLRDPGNFGTILRTAEAAGISTIITTQESVDPFNPKVVRAAMGAHMRIRLLEGLDWDSISKASEDRQILLAEAAGGKRYYDVDWTVPSVLILGSEAQGVSQAAKAIATATVSIPMLESVESLNVAVAAGIIIFEALRQISTKGNEKESRQGKSSRE